MKDIDIMKEIINKNADMESNKQLRENAEKNIRTKELSVTFLKIAKMYLLKRFRKMIESILNVILKMI